MYNVACGDAVIFFRNPLQKQTYYCQSRHEENKYWKTEPGNEYAYVVKREKNRTNQSSCHLTPEKPVNKASEKSLLQKGVAENDICKYIKTVLWRQVLLSHEILSDTVKIKIVSENKKERYDADRKQQHAENNGSRPGYFP